MVQEALCAGEETGVASQLAPRQLPAASWSPARLSESGTRGEGSVKGRGGRVGVTKRGREGAREGGRESAARAQVYLPQPIKPGSLGDSAKSTAGASSDVRASAASHGGPRPAGATELRLNQSYRRSKRGSSLDTLL
ncbi:hypothetical protein EYF80_047058 [Liparis tanakae]|uniref:Uncharacterized protein n=1 Tax=Liparis tanakae TaxID=230148 RepID=A0A4Z2FQY1_9TELE|nr:hypothetical protein EYF80_047058 [Liparis tanakae]